MSIIHFANAVENRAPFAKLMTSALISLPLGQTGYQLAGGFGAMAPDRDLGATSITAFYHDSAASGGAIVMIVESTVEQDFFDTVSVVGTGWNTILSTSSAAFTGTQWTWSSVGTNQFAVGQAYNLGFTRVRVG